MCIHSLDTLLAFNMSLMSIKSLQMQFDFYFDVFSMGVFYIDLKFFCKFTNITIEPSTVFSISLICLSALLVALL